MNGMENEILRGENYKRLLDIPGTGIMGSLDILKIDVKLPIYHGTVKEALSNGVGHLEGPNLPFRRRKHPLRPDRAKGGCRAQGFLSGWMKSNREI